MNFSVLWRVATINIFVNINTIILQPPYGGSNKASSELDWDQGAKSARLY